MIIAIDHGNSEIKTVHDRFTAGFTAFDRQPPLTQDWIEYLGRYYALAGVRLPYHHDKTLNEDYYILTLFAIGRELTRAHIHSTDVQLAVGLPPRYFAAQKDRFRDYLLRGRKEVAYRYAGQQIAVRVTDVHVYPQCWAAMITRQEIRALPTAVIVDIGGGTVDILKVQKGIPDVSELHSLQRGTNHLLADVLESLEAASGDAPGESLILDTIAGRSTTLPESEQAIIRKQARAFAEKTLYELQHDHHVRADREPVYFCGGGAVLLRNYLPQSPNVHVIDDPLANAKGFATVAGAPVV